MAKHEDNIYKINTKAVDDLVDATPDNTPHYSEEELKKYRTKSKIQISGKSKALLIKLWFSGAVCYFFIWGLGMYIASTLDLFFVTAIGMGFVKDILENNALRWVADPPGSNDRWMMVPKKRYISLIFNVLYSFVVMFCVMMTYEGVNGTLSAITGQTEGVLFGIEPVTFALIYLLFDLFFLWIKHFAAKIIADARSKVEKGD